MVYGRSTGQIGIGLQAGRSARLRVDHALRGHRPEHLCSVLLFCVSRVESFFLFLARRGSGLMKEGLDPGVLYSRYLYRQDHTIKTTKAQEEEEAAAAADAAKEEPPAQPEKTPLMAQAEADVKALENTPSLPALWWAYGNLTARIGKSLTGVHD